MTVNLRPHHLLCLLTYVGKGYSPQFVDHFNAVIKRLNLGERALICSGPDEICRPLLGKRSKKQAHCLCHKIDIRDRLADLAITKFTGYRITEGRSIELNTSFLNKMREAFKQHQIRQACIGCQWRQLCTSVAEKHYTDSLIQT